MNNIEEQYRQQFNVFDAFTKRLHQLLETVLENYPIKYHVVESRTKTIESFLEKVNRKQDKYTSPLKQITDICALRIIVFYIDDLEKVDALLKSAFTVDQKNSINAKENLTENQFGYLSSHYVISLKKDRSKLPEWVVYKTLKAEIQVRTVLQHAWAAISHELEYKKTYDIPSPLKRKLFRLAGLIELADEEFQEAREKHQIVEQAIRDKKPLNNVKVFDEINLNTLQDYFQRPSEILTKLKDLSLGAGYEFSTMDDAERNDYLSDLVELCKIKNLATIDAFDAYLKEEVATAGNNLKELYHTNSSTMWFVSVEFMVLILFIISLDEKQFKEYQHKAWGNVWESTIVPYVRKKQKQQGS